MPAENNAKSSISSFAIEDGFLILWIQNEDDSPLHLSRPIESNFIQFHFCIKGEGVFSFNGGNYKLPIVHEKSLLLYNSLRELPLDLELSAQGSIISILVSIKKFHSLFSEEAAYIDFLQDDNKEKKYYQENRINPSMAVVLSQILNFNLHHSVKRLYLKGKSYELLGLYFNRPDEVDVEQCPFLTDEDNMRKIRKAKEIIISKMTEPPGLQELSEEIGLGLKKLKEGFKEVYGDTVYGFLFDYKMEYARKLLESGSHNVNEVGMKIGYSTASHFIAAFKKKFGTTPKKYLMELNAVG